MTFPTRIVLAPSTLLLSLILSACGGGGGGSTADTNDSSVVTLAAISQSNFQTVAATSSAPVGDLMDLNNTRDQFVSGVEVRQSSLNLASASTAIYKRFRANNSQLVTGAVVTQQCTGGGSVSIDESTASTGYTVGDRVTITLANCKEPDLPMLNGAATFAVTSVSGDPANTNTYSLGIAVTFNNFVMAEGTDGATINGDLAVVASQNGTSAVNFGISGTSLAVTTTVSGTTAKTYKLASYNLTGTESNGVTSISGKYSLSGSSSKLNGDFNYNVEILRPLTISSSSDFPTSGSYIVRGSPATVTVTALNATSVQLDYSDKGDGVTLSRNTLAWPAFAALD